MCANHFVISVTDNILKQKIYCLAKFFYFIPHPLIYKKQSFWSKSPPPVHRFKKNGFFKSPGGHERLSLERFIMPLYLYKKPKES